MTRRRVTATPDASRSYPRVVAARRLSTLLLAIAALLPSGAPLADDLPRPGWQPGDCAVFREGGSGWVLKAPTYWLKGSVFEVARERRMANVCPVIGRQFSAFTRADHLRLAAALPCVRNESAVREVEVTRIRLAVDAWETPWSHQHGSAGWLFRGQFLDRTLKKGELIDMDASWLEPCEAGS